MAPLDLNNVQSQIRLTAFRLGQLRERHNQTSNITKRDVATLISQGEINVAKSKVEKLVRDDKMSSLIERLQISCNQLLEKVAELGQPIDFESKSPLLEAVCSVMLVAFRTEELKDVNSLRDMLVQMYGQEFNRLALRNYPNHVSRQVIDGLDARPPPPAQVDVYMVSISDEYNLSWNPPLLPHQKSHALSEILDQGAFPRIINVKELRQICSRGIPLQPSWLRPRMWKLLLGTLPYQKDSWEADAYTKRQSYYDLARTLLSRLIPLPLPSSPPSLLDTSLFNLAKSLSPLPKELYGALEQSPLCPFDNSAPDGLRIEIADAVDQRLKLIQGHIDGVHNVDGIPENRLDSADTTLQMPQISVFSPMDSPMDDRSRKKPGTLLHQPVLTRSHTTSLLRLSYIHMALHPSTSISFLTSVLLPLYVTMVQEVEPAELAHVEPDTFWLLAELWGEVSELGEDEGSRLWVAKFGKRLAWADPELSSDLCRKGLDPTLPHYSYRWLVPLLTRTLPFPSVLTIWDSLFAQPQRTSDHNAKLEFLVDICTSLLINARVKLFRLGRPAFKTAGLWGDVDITVVTPSHASVEFEEEFTQGMALLQAYPIDELGGPERVIDTAIGLGNQRKHADKQSSIGFNLGGRLRETVWSSFITRATPAEPPIPESNDESDDAQSPQWLDSGTEDNGHGTGKSSALLGNFGNTVWRGLMNQNSMDDQSSPLPPGSPVEPSSPASSVAGTRLQNATGAGGIGSRFGNSIWRGFTNQSAMEVPPSPTESTMSIAPRPESDGFASPSTASSLWSYTEKFKDSDAAASLSKTSTNWTARASALWGRSIPSSTVSSPEYTPHHSRTGSLSVPGKSWAEIFPKRGSLPAHYDEYSPPQRPNFRDSKYLSPQERNALESPTRAVIGLSSPLLVKSKSALASLTGATTTTTKSAPRPLLLSSSSLMTSSTPHRPSRSVQPKDRISSASSVSTSLSLSQNQTHRDSEASRGRFVALRRGVPPHPPRSSRIDLAQSDTEDSTAQLPSPDIESEPLRPPFRSKNSRGHERRRSSEDGAIRGWSQVELLDSPSTIPSSTPPKSPITVTSGTNTRVNRESEERHGYVALNVPEVVRFPQEETKVAGKKSWNTTSGLPVSPRPPVTLRKVDSDSSTSQDNTPSIRGKRHGQRPTNLRLKKSDTDIGRSSAMVEQRSNGDVASLVPSSSETSAITPRATDFHSPGSPERPTRVRKNSRSPRPALRKVDLPTKESFSSDGDDEGYDDFLSAYESEDSALVAAI